MTYTDEINEAVSRMTFGQKREARLDWESALSRWEHYGRKHGAARPSDFRDWLAERTEQRLQNAADRNNADFERRPARHLGMQS